MVVVITLTFSITRFAALSPFLFFAFLCIKVTLPCTVDHQYTEEGPGLSRRVRILPLTWIYLTPQCSCKNIRITNQHYYSCCVTIAMVTHISLSQQWLYIGIMDLYSIPKTKAIMNVALSCLFLFCTVYCNSTSSYGALEAI